MKLPRASEPHPEVQAFLEMYEALDVPSFDELPPEEVRRMTEEMRAGMGPNIEMDVEDEKVEGPNGEVPVRLYEPDATAGDERPHILYMHGGGWVIGSVETHDGVCRKLADETGYPVASVDYGLAPEHPFPEGLEDCYAVLEWVAEKTTELNADSIVVAGDSAGGNLATATALLARDRDGPEIAYQLLVYPSTGRAEETPAYDENSEGYFLRRDDMEWFRDRYFADEIDRGNVYARPRLADDLSDLPPATVVTAGYDPLRDDGGAYAERLEDAGVSVSHHHYDDVIHGFFSMIAEPADLERAHEAHEAVAEDLRAFFADG
ncbi:MAG: alpha/beta hydrolase [Halobacteriales archaeon]|nr:alpha/beta hydrolase [Halobacteriales archaeon]